MPTTDQISNYQTRIYQQLRAGTPVNEKGLPDLLSKIITYAQVPHETGNFSHRFFTEGNNIDGYAFVPGARWQKGPGPIADNGKAIAYYHSIEDSARELVDWIYRRVHEGKFPVNLDSIRTPGDYAMLLKNAGYYGDEVEDYTTGMNRFWKNVKDNAGTGLVVISFAVLIWLLTRTAAGKRIFK